ncbi:MAG: hypothetical protein JNM19_17060 [Chitinophagaceae bacterium]|nr:hypothetical protein [Chitinophagaceae bacterium]
MKKTVPALVIAIFSLTLISCGGKKQSAASVAKEWCDLNAKAHKAEGPAKEAAEAARKKFEEKMEAKYKGDEAFMKEVGAEVEKCEAASEGR